MFNLESNGFQLRRHRHFECSFSVWQIATPACQHGPRTIGVFGSKARNIAEEKRHYAKPASKRGQPDGVVLPQHFAFEAMGIDWMNISELAESIPPAYSKWIGKQLIRVVGL